MKQTPDEKKKEERADKTVALSDSELEQVSGGRVVWGDIIVDDDCPIEFGEP